MKPQTSHRALKAGLYFPALVILCTGAVQAASSTWSGATDGDFLTATNWSAGVPGAASGTTNTDIATFNNNVNNAVSLTAGRNLRGITFNGNLSGLGAFTLTGSPLTFSTLGTIAVTGMNSNSNQSIANNLSLVGTANNDLLISTPPGYTGTVSLGGSITSAAVTGTSQIAIAGGLGSNMNFTGNITNGTGTNIVTLQLGSANRSTVTLAGNNTFGGTGGAPGVLVRGGSLIADYSGGKIPLSTASRLSVGSGILEIKGASSGTTTATVNSLEGLASSYGTVVVNSNGGGGTTLALGATEIIRGGSSALLFDLSSTGSAITYGVANNTLGLLKTSSLASTFFVKNATGIGFATVAAGSIVRNTTYASALPTSGGAGTSNYSLTTAGTLTATGNISLGTVDVNTTAGAITIDMGANLLRTSNGNGSFSLLVTGSNDFALNSTGAGGFGGAGNTAMQLAHFGTGTVTIGARSLGTGVTRSGSGLVVFNNAGTQSEGGNTLIDGVTRYTTVASVGTNLLTITGGATFEVGGDLNGASAGDFSRSLGGGNGNIFMNGSVGFSAHGADRVVNIGGLSAALTWAGANIFTGTLTLGSTVSTHTLEIQNPINLNGFDRNVRAENGTAAVDGKLSGEISGTGVGIRKTGAGTLELTVANTYTGSTLVSEGKLLVSGSLAAGSAVEVSTGATLGGAGTVAGTVKAAGTIAPGNSAGTLNAGPTTLTGTLAVEIDAAAGDKLLSTGAIDLTGATLTVNLLAGGFTQASYVIAEGTSLVGTFASVPSGYSVSYSATQATLTTMGGGNTYADWLALNSPATGFETDTDLDGLANGVENVFGTNPNAYSTGLTEISSTASSVAYKHPLNPTIASDVSYSYEWSTDLIEWKASGSANTGGTTATINAGAPVSGIVTVTTTVSSGPAAKLFTRIKAVK